MAWVTKDSTETYNQTPEPPREYTKKEKELMKCVTMYLQQKVFYRC